MSEELSANITWTDELEAYFSSTAERAACYSWLHKKAESKYSRYRNFIDIPVITLSSCIGFLSVGSEQIFQNSSYAPVGLGILSLFVSVLSTLQSYFKWTQRATEHAMVAIQWAKLHRFLVIELNLPRDQRMACNDLLKMVKTDYDRLQEVSPLLPSDIILAFKKEFSTHKELSKPEETNGIEPVKPIKNPLLSLDVRTPYSSHTSRKQTEGQTPGELTISIPSQASS